MSGKILVVDGLATNRIVLKVKLSTAYYDVVQAATGAEALDVAAREAPDIVLLGSDLPDLTGPEFLQRLAAQPAETPPPALMFLTRDDPETRLAALKAGAADILIKPVEEQVLMARLRSVLRHHQSARDLQMHSATAQEIGFSEAAGTFNAPGRIGLIAGGHPAALRLQTDLRSLCPHQMVSLDPEGALATPKVHALPDIYLLRVAADGLDEMRGLITKLRAAPHSSRQPVIALLAADAADHMASLLDMGADDVIAEGRDARELVLRLNRQINDVQRARAIREQLRHSLEAAMIDPLTGLYNRRYALPYLERLAAAAHGEARSFAVMVADLDHFKQVNDCHGHATGDRMLCHVARVLKNCLRPNDMVARIGGEEFLIVVPNCTAPQARRLAGRLCDRVRDSALCTGRNRPPVAVTISIGVTLCHPQPELDRPDVHGILDEADRALYGSKSGGRNTVTFCTRPAA